MGYVRIIFLSLSRTLLVLEMLKIYKLLPQERNSIVIHFSHQMLDNGTIYQLLHTTHSVEALKKSLNMYVYSKPIFYYSCDRIGQVYHTQMCTNCSPLNYYLCHKNIIESPLWSNWNKFAFPFRMQPI